MNVERLIDKMADAGSGEDEVSLGEIVEALGPRSFGPLLLLAGLITLAPLIGDIPGMPTLMGILVLLVAVQLLLNRKHFWLPRWLLRRAFSREKFC
ncbi:MAG: exopolysaccharide biosynthesis protein, partial [Bacteroidota bacterium]